MTSVMRVARWLRRRRALRRRFNPYVVGTPVFDSSLLFGRGQLTARILDILSSRSVRLTGEHRIGKTSFLHHLQKALSAQDGVRRFVPVFVDLEAVPAARVLRVLMEETVETLALEPRTLGLRLDSRDGYHARGLIQDVKRVVAELRGRTRAEARLVFLVDEVDAMWPDPEPNGEPWLSTLLEECSEELRVVLAGVNGKESRPGDPRSQGGRLEDLALAPLDPDDARELVTRPVAHCFRFEPSAVERIVQLAKGRPYLLQKLCLNALNRMLDEGRTTVRLADVESMFRLGVLELPRRSADAIGTRKSA